MGVAARLRRAGRLVVPAVACLLAVSGCGGSTSPSPAAQSATSPAADELAGSWTTVGPVTCEQWTTAINAAFTPEQLAPYGEMLRACPAAIALRFLDGELTVNINGTDAWGPGPYRIIDDHTFEAGDDCSFCVRYQFEVEGDMLTIDVVKDDDPAGLEDSIAQTGIYESVPFERASAR